MKSYLRCAPDMATWFSDLGSDNEDWTHLKKGFSQGCPAFAVLFTDGLKGALSDLIR